MPWHDLGVLSWTPSKTAQSADLLNCAADLKVESCIHPGHREAFRIHVHVLYQCFDLASSYTIQVKPGTLFASCIMTNEVCWHISSHYFNQSISLQLVKL